MLPWESFNMGKDTVDTFKKAFEKTMVHEGGYSFDELDPGGETYLGISRVYWPSWEGWPIIDKAMESGRPLSSCIELPPMARNFYRANFWNRFKGDDVAALSPSVAMEMFDTAVNLGVHKASKYLQGALNLLNRNGKSYPDMVVDGVIGPTTIRMLNLYLSQNPGKDGKEKLLLNVMNVLQGIHYVKQMRRYPEKERFRGWFARV